jgi:hypothetical protein
VAKVCQFGGVFGGGGCSGEFGEYGGGGGLRWYDAVRSSEEELFGRLKASSKDLGDTLGEVVGKVGWACTGLSDGANVV